MVYANSKWGKYCYLKTAERWKPYLPQTQRVSRANVRAMLKRWGAVYLKPNNGTGGHGIMKITRIGEGRYTLRSGFATRTFRSFGSLYSAVSGKTAGRSYLAQKAIPLLHYKKRPFDLRIMVQRNRQQGWDVTGIVGRLARPRKIVTNYHSGGTPMPAGKLLSPHIHGTRRSGFIQELKNLGRGVSEYMSVQYPKFPAFGVDVAIDATLKPWILEVNTKPDKSIFNALKNKTMYKRILSYARMQKRS
ncbi:YheC/YheD family protein [Paenibacillus ehimensis]|uniref:YheC/YheD family protein n=1 Tax=Paenibacillus ehimensis TaxID=79264 RepID=A0ABT8V8Z4_9BACL|nr:YheC/YheD family protein [Paenibacillus ehimensis]MDO3677448.1 YheC/YheD family protein [Paenibacillus ehimensis]MEC0212499.1 YheC/YheD family protein [Paenibacillus ehimensis]